MINFSKTTILSHLGNKKFITRLLFVIWLFFVLHIFSVDSFESFEPIKSLVFVFGLIINLGLFIAFSINNESIPARLSVLPLLPFALCIFAFFVSGSALSEIRHYFGLFHYLALCLTFVIGYLFSLDPSFKIFIFKTLIISAWAQGILVFLQAFGLDPFFYLTGSGAEWQVYTTIGNPNHVAAYLVPIILLSFSNKIIKSKKIRIFSIVFLCIAVILTGSRMGSAILIFCFLLNTIKKPKSLFSLRIEIVLSIISISSAFIVKYLMGQGWGARSILCRIAYWNTSWELIKARPFLGYGLGNFEASYLLGAFKRLPYVSIVPQHAHNDWIEMAVEGGLFFPILLLLILFYVIYSNWHQSKDSRLLSISLVASFLHASWDSPLQQSITAMLFCLLFGIGINNKHAIISKRSFYTIVVACLILLSLNTGIFIRHVKAHHLASTARDLAMEGNWDASSPLWKKAWELDKSEGAFAYWYAQTLASKNKFDEAAAYLNQALLTYASFDAYILKTKIEFYHGNKQEAKAFIKKLYETFPENMQVIKAYEELH